MAIQKGIVLQTADGGTYFIRDEILQRCRVADDEMAVVEKMLEEQEEEVEGFAMQSYTSVAYGPGLTDSSSISVSPNIYSGDQLSGAFTRRSTEMCCW